MDRKLLLPDNLSIRASFASETLDRDARTIDVVFSTDEPVLMGHWERFYEILSFDPSHVRLDRLNSGAPVLWMHDLDEYIGIVERAWTDGSKGHAKVRFGKRGKADEVFNDVVDGIIRNISVGYRVYSYKEIEGGEATIPTYKAVDWEPKEISFVTVPADYKATVRSERELKNEVIILNNKENEKSMTGKNNQNSEEVITPPSVISGLTRSDVEAAARAAAEEATRAERERAVAIRSAVSMARLEASFAEDLISRGVSLDAARAEILEKWASVDPAANTRNVHISVGLEDSEKQRNSRVAALLTRGGVVANISNEEREGARAFMYKRLLDHAKDSLLRLGQNPAMMSDDEIVKRAITSSGSDFPILLSGLNRQVLLDSYSTQPDTWRSFCAIGSVSDFREYRRLRLGSLSNLDNIKENGEFKTKALSDAEYESIRIKTVGNVINLSRQMIINDDLNGLIRIVQSLGRAAKRTIEADVYALLALNGGSGPLMSDGKTLFHADHGNIASTGAPVTVSSIDAVRAQMLKQKDKNKNDYLHILPEIWLGPIEQEGTVKVVNEAQYDVDVQNKFQVPNKSRGIIKTIIGTPYLSGKPWYVFANPSITPTIEVAFLNGAQTPFLDSEEQFLVDGIQWKIRHDYGVSAVDYRGVIRNAGE